MLVRCEGLYFVAFIGTSCTPVRSSTRARACNLPTDGALSVPEVYDPRQERGSEERIHISAFRYVRPPAAFARVTGNPGMTRSPGPPTCRHFITMLINNTRCGSSSHSRQTASMFLYAQGSSVVCAHHDTLTMRRFARHSDEVLLLAVDNLSEIGIGKIGSQL